jgi:outer membrane lipoprotein SlyB
MPPKLPQSWSQAAGALALLAAVPALTGCAAPPRPTPVAQTSPLTGRMTQGTVVSVRTVDVAAGNTALAKVLTSLGQPAAASTPPAVELIIRRQDSSIVSVVQPQQAGQPVFALGESVNIAEAAATVVHPQ